MLGNHDLALNPDLFGHTPVPTGRCAEMPAAPCALSDLVVTELALLLLAVWQAGLALRDERTLALSLSFLAVVLFLTVVHIGHCRRRTLHHARSAAGRYLCGGTPRSLQAGQVSRASIQPPPDMKEPEGRAAQ